MSRPKIDPDALRAYLDGGHSQADAAAHFNVSEAAISQRVKQLQIATSKVIALERAADVVDQQLTATDRLARVQQSIIRQLDWAEAKAQRPDADRAGLIDTIVKLCAEARAQLRLELDISRTLIDLRVVREFQQAVIAEINIESPELARRIMDRLRARRALRPSGELPPLDGEGGL